MPNSGVGTTFSKWEGSAWDTIAQIKSITGPGMSRDTLDTTTLDTAGGYRTFIAGFRNPGTVVLNMNFTRAGYDMLKADFESDTEQTYQIALPDDDNTNFEFGGLVTELPLNISEDIVNMDVTIQISGQVTVDSESS